jgi:hypothetical protein
MKKSLIILILIASATAVSNAQFFAEGNFGMGYSSQSGDVYDAPFVTVNSSSSLSIHVSPKAGYWMNEHVAAGVGIAYSIYTSKPTRFETNDPDYPVREAVYKNKTPEWMFSVFGRYKLWGKEKFSLLLESSVGTGISSSMDVTESGTKKTESSFEFTVDVFPLVSYDLTERISIAAKCDFLSLGFYYGSSKGEHLNAKRTYSSFGVNTQSSTAFRIGFIYNLKNQTNEN